VVKTRIELKGTPDGRLRMRRTDSVGSSQQIAMTVRRVR
jgi:hypothetical protein